MRRSWTETRGLLALVAAVAAYGLVTPGTALAQQETAPEATVLVDEPSGGRWLRPFPDPGPIADPHFYFGVEYLLWWTSGMNAPPILTTGPTDVLGPSGRPGVVGAPGTQVLAGNAIDFSPGSGARLTVGGWLSDDKTLGAEVTYLFIGQHSSTRTASQDGSAGSAPVSIPYQNALLGGVADSTSVALPGSFSGTGTLSTTQDLQNFEANLPMRLIENGRWRLDGLTGFRWLILNEVTTLSTYSRDNGSPVYLQTTDRFNAQNNFYGGQLGLRATGVFDRWTVQGYGKVALGSTASDVKISGSGLSNQFTSAPGISNGYPGGYLAQPTNEGHYRDANFAVIPEVGFNVGYEVCAHTRLFMGYSALYLSQAARPGEQISPLINPSQSPAYTNVNSTQLVGPAAPLPTNTIGDFWAHGLNFGAEWRW